MRHSVRVVTARTLPREEVAIMATIHNENTSADEGQRDLDRAGFHKFIKIGVPAAVAALTFFWAFTGVLLARNPFPFHTMAWWLPIGIVLAPLIAFAYETIDQFRFRTKGTRASDYFRQAGRDFVDYVVVRLIAAIVTALAITVAWILLVVLYFHTSTWAFLVGVESQHTTGLGAFGTFIGFVLYGVFVLAYVKILNALIGDDMDYVKRLLIWGAVVVVGLLPFLGWSFYQSH